MKKVARWLLWASLLSASAVGYAACGPRGLVVGIFAWFVGGTFSLVAERARL